jgi:hypothetical protein
VPAGMRDAGGACESRCRFWCRLGVDQQETQSKEGEVADSSKCTGDHGFPRIHAEITPPPRTGFEPAGRPFESRAQRLERRGDPDTRKELREIDETERGPMRLRGESTEEDTELRNPRTRAKYVLPSRGK